MTQLKRNMIELVKNPDEINKGGEPEFEKYWTPAFLPFEVTLEAVDLMAKLEELEDEGGEGIKSLFDLLIDFTANKAYGKQFTVNELKERLHAPDALGLLQSQLIFIAQGQQTDETKKFLAKKR